MAELIRLVNKDALLEEWDRQSSRGHYEFDQTIMEFPTTTEAEIRAKAYERFSIEAVRQFIEFDEEHDFISIGVCLDIISKVAEQLKEE